MSVETFDPVAVQSGVRLSISAAARRRMASDLAATQARGMRLTTNGSGCSGYSYFLNPVPEARRDDLRFELEDGVAVFVPKPQRPQIDGTVIDFIDDAYQFSNPHAKRECGCDR